MWILMNGLLNDKADKRKVAVSSRALYKRGGARMAGNAGIKSAVPFSRTLKVFSLALYALVVCVSSVAAGQTWVTVCADAGAGGYEAFPDVCRLEDGRLMAVFYAGYGHVSLPNATLPNGGRISYCISADEGQTWSAAQTLFDGPYDDRDPSITQLKDGRLICTFFTLKPTTGSSYVGLGTFSVISADRGVTWDTTPQQISTNYYCSSPVRELSDGRLILGLYSETGEDAFGAVTISDNGGADWSDPIDIPNNGLRYEAETDVIELKDGSLFAALRGQNHSGWSVSSDGGETWSTAEQFGFPGHSHYLHRTPDDVILMAHRLPNTSLHYSLDECQTWSTNIVIDSVYGAYPSMVTLRDGSTLIVYYEEGAGSNIRAKRFRVTPDGFEWLSPTPGWTVNRVFLNSAGGAWIDSANWVGGILPTAGEIANLSVATGTIELTAGVTTGEIYYNPLSSGETNTLTIVSDTGEPFSRMITLSTTLTNHLQVGKNAELRLDVDLLSNGNLLKDGYGSLVVGRRLFSDSTAAFYEYWIEQGRLVNEGTITAPHFRLRLGTLEPEAGAASELVLREGSAYLTTSTSYHNDVLLGGNRLAGDGTNSRAVVTHEGGILDLTVNRTSGAFLNGYAKGGDSVYNFSGGEVNLSNKVVYVGFNGKGVINQSGGSFKAGELVFSSAGSGRYNLTGGDLWLGGIAQNGGGTAIFNIGGGRIHPFNKGFNIWHSASPQFTGSGGLTRFCSENSGFTNAISGVEGSGGFIKEGADTLNIQGGEHSFSGPVIVSNGTVNVRVPMTGGNAVTLFGGNLTLGVGVYAKFSSLTVTGGVFQMHTNSLVVITANDPWTRISGNGALALQAGAQLLCLDVSEQGIIELSGGTATVHRARIDGIELPAGLYSSQDFSQISGRGRLAVTYQSPGPLLYDTFSRSDGDQSIDSLGKTEVGFADWCELQPWQRLGDVASIVDNELRLGVGNSDPALALTGASWPNGDFSTRMRFNRVGQAGNTVKNSCGFLLRASVGLRTYTTSELAGAVHVQMTATGGLFLRENYIDTKYSKNPFTGGDFCTYGEPGSLPTSINGLPFDADGDGRLGDDEPFELRALLSGHRLQVLINGAPIMAFNGFQSVSASEENCAGLWINRLSRTYDETHDSYHDSFSVSNLPFLIRHVGDYDPNIAAPAPLENWTLNGDTNAVPVGPITETIAGETVKAWRVDDLSTATLANYRTSLSNWEVAGANTHGWRLTMRLRVVNSNDAVDGSVSGQVSTDNLIVSITFGSDSSGNALVQVTNGSTHTVPGGSVYHTYELEYDPITDTLALKCDGDLLQMGIPKSIGAYKRVLWGANQSTSTGCGHYESVRFSILWPEPPEPFIPPPPPPPAGTLLILR